MVGEGGGGGEESSLSQGGRDPNLRSLVVGVKGGGLGASLRSGW